MGFTSDMGCTSITLPLQDVSGVDAEHFAVDGGLTKHVSSKSVACKTGSSKTRLQTYRLGQQELLLL